MIFNEKTGSIIFSRNWGFKLIFPYLDFRYWSSCHGNYKGVLAELPPTKPRQNNFTESCWELAFLQPLFFCQVSIWWENVPMDVGLIGLCSAVLIMMVAAGYIWLCRKQKYWWSWEARQEGREISALFFTFIDWGRPGRHVILGYKLAEFRQFPAGPQLYGREEGHHMEVGECPAVEGEELVLVFSVHHTGRGWQRRWWRGWGSSSSSPPGLPLLGNTVRLSWWR